MTYDSELKFAIQLAREAGVIMKRYFRANDLNTQWKSDDTPLTVADTAINRLVIERVREVFPDCGVHGEEESFHTERELLWVCDPVDGTMPYSLGLPISTFSLGLVHNGRPVVGVVYDPFGDRLFSARIGHGAELNGRPIHVSEKALAGSYVTVDMLAGAPGALEIPDFRGALLELSTRPFTLLSFVISAMMVATGETTVAYFGFTKPEDLAAAKIIVEEAGGTVTDVDGKDQPYDRQINGAVVSNGAAHDAFLEVIRNVRR